MCVWCVRVCWQMHPGVCALRPVDKVLAFILAGLRSRAISTHAAWAIQAICEHCRESMVQNLDGLLQVGEGVGQDKWGGLYLGT